MLAVRTYEPQQRREIAGSLLALAFTALAAVRDVYLGGLFQRLDPLLVALTAFGLCSLGPLPLMLARDRDAAALLARGALPLLWINLTTAVAWLSFFFALKTIEPALVQILFYGVGPLSVRWLDGLVPGSAPATLGRTERALHLGLLAALVAAAAARGVVLAAGGRRVHRDQHAALPGAQRRRREPGHAALAPISGGRAARRGRRAGPVTTVARRRHAGRVHRAGAGVPAANRPAELRQPGGRGPGLARDRARRPRPGAGPGVHPAARRGAPDVLAVDTGGGRALRGLCDLGRHLDLRGPSYRTRHVKLDLHHDLRAPSGRPTRTSGNQVSEFPEPTFG